MQKWIVKFVKKSITNPECKDCNGTGINFSIQSDTLFKDVCDCVEFEENEMGYQVENNKVIIFGEDIRIFDYFEELSRIRVGLYDAIIYSEIVIAHGTQKNDFNVEELKELKSRKK